MIKIPKYIYINQSPSVSYLKSLISKSVNNSFCLDDSLIFLSLSQHLKYTQNIISESEWRLQYRAVKLLRTFEDETYVEIINIVYMMII